MADGTSPPDDRIGAQETVQDTLDLRQARHMQLALDRAPDMNAGDPLPPFWHYLYFNPQIRASDLAEDGHEKLGRFLPDLGLPRRMWAGGSVTFTNPVPLGAAATKLTTIRDVTRKEGRSGPLGFVTVTHDITVGGTHCLTETQNIVYRAPPSPDAPLPAGVPAPNDATWRQEVRPDPVLLFRYSALIFYGHRIHYDADYTRGVEGYPGLVVHGPLTATLLADFGMSKAGSRPLKRMDIRAISPLFAPSPFWLEGREAENGLKLWARNGDDNLAMTVDLELGD